MKILLAEDEKTLAKAVLKLLRKSNYMADGVYNGKDALMYLQSGDYDVAIIDIMMPEIDGISVIRELRKGGSTIPILILTAKSEIEDKVEGLDSGANYYLTKPFDARELLAALRVITRGHNDTGSKLSFGNVILNRATFELSSAYGEYRLANKEFQMMEMLMMNPHYIISAEKFMEKIWGFDSNTEINVVWVYISYLRKKLAALNANIQIKAIRNAGYSLEEKNDKEITK